MTSFELIAILLVLTACFAWINHWVLHLPRTIGLLVMGAAAGYFLLTEHRAHFFGALPYLLLLACLLMHFFMHRGHGGHGRGRIQSEGEAPGRKASPGAGEQR